LFPEIETIIGKLIFAHEIIKLIRGCFMFMAQKFLVEIGSAKLIGEQKGEGPPLILLHAGVADRRMWQPQMSELSDSFHVEAYDRRGFGETEAADVPFSHVEDLRLILDQLGIGKASLVGCSQGGRVAIDFTLAYPDRVESLVLIAPAVSGAPSPDSFPARALELDEELDAAGEAGDFDRVNEIEALFWLDGPTSPEGRVNGAVRDLFLDMNGIALAHPELEEEIEPPPAYRRVSNLELPVLVLWGDLDFPHVQDRCRYLVQTIPGAHDRVIPGTAHLPNLERPQLVSDLIREHLM
jgi:pimeloyl-ACP methyl ester carboxylesterase